jgi:hypothetical protein
MYFGVFRVKQVCQNKLKSHDANWTCLDLDWIAQNFTKSVKLRGGYKWEAYVTLNENIAVGWCVSAVIFYLNTFVKTMRSADQGSWSLG